MTAIVDICNRALSEIGTQSQITDLNQQDVSAEAVACALWYDNLRKRLLRTAHWGFARKQLSGAQIGDLVPDGTSPYPFLFKYTYPADCLKMRYVLAPPIQGNSTVVPLTGDPVESPFMFGPSRSNRFLVAWDTDANGNPARVLVTNVQQAILVYTADVTDPNAFDPLFEGALTSALSYKLVIPLTGNVGERQQFQAAAQQAIIEARVADGNEAIPKTDHMPDWIVGRGVGGPFGNGPWGIGGPNDSWGSWWGGWDDMAWGE